VGLDQCDIVAFVATANPRDALVFYRDVLGLRLIEDSPFAIVMQGNNASIRIQKVKSHSPQPFTVLGWKVQDIAATAAELASKGVKFERFEGMKQDEQGIWLSPGGAKVCWFKDPDGNVLSLTQGG
jgi:catechol 2,3-dioxygenase-like lactoylglutathione lyase family enzyme